MSEAGFGFACGILVGLSWLLIASELSKIERKAMKEKYEKVCEKAEGRI